MNIFKKSKLLAIAGSVAIVALGLLPVMSSQAAQDCNNNAVTYCGASSVQDLLNKIQNGDGVNSAANLQQIYYNEGRGITNNGSATDINSSSTVDGVVTSSGQVLVNNQVVATNVWSSGRDFIQGSVQDGSLWMRPTSVSFLQPQLDAWVNMAGGTFHWAIIKSCGNPVKQISAPFGEIFKRVVDKTTDPNTDYAADDNAHALGVNSGDTLTYLIRVNNAGTTDMTNTVWTDNLPDGVTLISNPSLRNLSANLGTIAAGHAVQSTVTVKVTSTTAGAYIDNMACFTANGGQKGCDHAVVKINTSTTQSSFVCNSLTASPTSGNAPLTVNFNASASANGATITGYHFDFGDNATTDTTQNTASHVYQNAGNYTATVIVKTNQGNTEVTQNCSAKIAVNSTPPTTPPSTPPTSTTPPSGLPQTGAEDTMAGVFGTGILGYAVQQYRRSKRALLGALRNVQR